MVPADGNHDTLDGHEGAAFMGSAVIEDWGTWLADQSHSWIAHVRAGGDGFFQIGSGVGLGAVALCVDEFTGDILVCASGTS